MAWPKGKPRIKRCYSCWIVEYKSMIYPHKTLKEAYATAAAQFYFERRHGVA